MKGQKAFSFALLLLEVVSTLFVAGIVVPSLLRSDFATEEALSEGSLRTINFAGMAFSYTTHNLEFAILGGLVGAIAALAVHFQGPVRKNTNSPITLPGAALRH